MGGQEGDWARGLGGRRGLRDVRGMVVRGELRSDEGQWHLPQLNTAAVRLPRAALVMSPSSKYCTIGKQTNIYQ
jgi:hypothetical protein